MIAMQKCKRNLRIAAEFGHAATHSTHMAIIKPGSLGLIRPAKGKTTIEYRLDSRKPSYTVTIGDSGITCGSCQNLLKREAAAKKIGDAVGGVGRALGEGLLQGVRRNE